LQQRFAELREARARGTTNELNETVSLARKDLAQATTALSTAEQHVGTDLAELRILNDSPSGDSDLRRTATELEKELRSYTASYAEEEEFLKLLRVAQADPDKLLAAPSVLLKSQPALGRLKDGLVDAQLRTGQSQGALSDAHPLVQAARAAEDAIRRQIHDEIAVAIQGVEVDLRVNDQRVQALEAQNAAVQQRLSKLSSVRAEYANLASAAKSRAESLKAVEHELSEARASEAAARTTSLIDLIDSPDTGTRPVGPGKTTIALGSFGGGLFLAAALLFLTVKPSTVPGPPLSQTLPSDGGLLEHPATSLSLKQALRRVSTNRP
jgi:uncharacterized protein involved in exopolysaccharide biosynthesis